MDYIELTEAIAGLIILISIFVRFLFDEKIYKVMNEIIIILLLIECLCNAHIKLDYRHQIELQKELIDIQNKHLKLYE